MTQRTRGSAANFREFLTRNVVLVAGEDHDNGNIDADSDDPVFVAIVIDVQGYGPHTGAISTQQNRFHGHPDAPLQTAYEVLEQWVIENNPEHFAELEQEYEDEATSVLTETFDGRTWKMSAREFAEAIRGTAAEKYIDVISEDGATFAGEDKDDFEPANLETIRKSFKVYFEHEGRDVEQSSREIMSRIEMAKDPDAALETANRLLDGHGVEAIRGESFRDNYYGDIVALYVNMGDTYNTTLLYETENDRFTVTSYGDWVEANTDEYNIR